MDSNAGSARYAFSRFVLDLGRGILLEDGEERALRPKSFALLRHMVENADRLINRDEILQAVWPGTFVTEDSITQCIREIRRALTDIGNVTLRTVIRRGYLLSGPVTRLDGIVTGAPSVTENPAGQQAAMVLPPSGRPTVIVLPFDNIGNDPEQGYFADGLTADLVTDLTRFQELHIVSPPRRADGLEPSALDALDEALPAASRFIVGGTLRRAGGRLRITVRLSDARTNVNLWGERFDRPLEDLFAVQEDLTNRIAALVDGQVGREGLRRLRRRPPANLDAYDLYLQGRELHGRATEADTLLARQIFDRAIAADPGYAPAYAYQAYTVQRGFTLGWGEPRGRAALDAALVLANRAVALEPESSLCMIRRAMILAVLGRHDEAAEVAGAAVAGNPCDAGCRAGYGTVLNMAGSHTDAVKELRVALSLDPFHPPFWWGTFGRALVLAGQPEEALAELHRCVARAPDYRPCYSSLVVACVETGRLDEARAAAREILRLRAGFVISDYDGVFGFRNEADTTRFLHAFRAAGMPER
jgi:TolB-like protein/Flp pilus assembly protein TadD